MPSIWTRCGATRNCHRLSLAVHRLVEDQARSSTLKLVDSLEEQRILEEVIDEAKPLVPAAVSSLGLHYLLSTPFRHPPLRNGSRFGRRHENGIFYGSAATETMLAEVAYYRLVLLEGSAAPLAPLQTRHSEFEVTAQSSKSIDLTQEPFRKYENQISSKSEYGFSQRLGTEMRAAGVEMFLFTSARAIPRRSNVALFAPVFRTRKPSSLKGWECVAESKQVRFHRTNTLEAVSCSFPREQFLVKGALPQPALR